jgi:signal transduction histidine kinase
MANARALNLFNVGDKDISGIMIEELLPRGVWSSIEPALIEEGHLSDVEATIGGDNEKIVSIAGSMIREPGGDPAGYVLIFHDITRRKESEKALRLANEKISLMTRLTRHDITNLVTALWGYLEFLKEDGSGRDRESYLDKCLEITRNITRHLQFSREYQDIGVYKPGWQSLEVMFAKAITDLPGGSKAITRSIDQVEIYADPLAYKVFYNVLENSLRHGGYVTQIDISTRVSGLGELLIQIEDNGAGIPEMDKENIFVHGFGKHTGIGLSLSREILAITGITIRETGTWEKGARFEMTVPKGMWRLTSRGA